MRVAWACGLLAVLIAGTSRTVQGESSPGTCQHGFASYLRGRGSLLQASLEFQREAWCRKAEGDSVGSCALEMSAAECLYAASDYTGTIHLLRARLSDIVRCDSCGPAILEARAFLRLGYTQRTMVLLDELRGGACWTQAGSAQEIAYLGGVTQLTLGNWAGAESWLSSNSPRLAPDRRLLIADSLCHVMQGLRLKSPRFAAALGLIPGAGYVYSGYPQTGAFALATVAAAVVAAVKAHQRGQSGFSGFMVGLSVVWYGGSIYGAWNTAERWNEWQRARRLSVLDY